MKDNLDHLKNKNLKQMKLNSATIFNIYDFKQNCKINGRAASISPIN